MVDAVALWGVWCLEGYWSDPMDGEERRDAPDGEGYCAAFRSKEAAEVGVQRRCGWERYYEARPLLSPGVLVFKPTDVHDTCSVCGTKDGEVERLRSGLEGCRFKVGRELDEHIDGVLAG